MWDAWTRLCEKNVESYHEHPGRNLAISAGLFIGGMIALQRYAIKVADDEVEARKHAIAAQRRLRN